jgi:hypothetical protein
MITRIIVIDNDRYLYEYETKILLRMLNNGINNLEAGDKKFCISKTGTNTRTIKIYKIIPKLIFFKNYKLVTTLKIKYN